MFTSITKYSDFCPQKTSPQKSPKKIYRVPHNKSKIQMKRKSTTKVIEKPKRYLSVYNIFFKEERIRIIEEAKANNVKGNVSESSESVENKDTLDNRPKRGRPRGPNYMKKKPHHAIGFNELAQTISSRWPSLKDEYFKKYSAEVGKDKIRYEKEMAEYKKLVKDENMKERKLKASNNNMFSHEPHSLNSMKRDGFAGSPQLNLHNRAEVPDNQASQFHKYQQSEYLPNYGSITSPYPHYTGNPYSNHRPESSESVCDHVTNCEKQNNCSKQHSYANYNPSGNIFDANEYYSHFHHPEYPNVGANTTPSRYFAERTSSNVINNNHNSYCQRYPEYDAQISSNQIGMSSENVFGHATDYEKQNNHYDQSQYATMQPSRSTYDTNEHYRQLNSTEDPYLRSNTTPSRYFTETTSSNSIHNNYDCQRYPGNETQTYSSNQSGTGPSTSNTSTPLPYERINQNHYSSGLNEDNRKQDR